MKLARKCEECGRELPKDAPDGLCPVCLLRLGAAELGMESAEARDRGELAEDGDEPQRAGIVIQAPVQLASPNPTFGVWARVFDLGTTNY